MKLLFALLALFPTAAMAAQNDGCIQKIAVSESWRKLSANDISCLRADTDFSIGLASLCTKNLSDTGVKYKKYIDYASQEKAAATSFLKATDPAEKSAAHIRWNAVRRDWRLFGFQEEVASYLALLAGAKNKCLSRPQLPDGVKEACGLDDRFKSPTDFVKSQKLAIDEANQDCGLYKSKTKAVRVSDWRNRHSDGQDCQRDPVDFSCVGGSMMYAPVNQSCANFTCQKF